MSHTAKQDNPSMGNTVFKMSLIRLTLSQANTCPKLRAIRSENLDTIASKR